MKGYWKPIAVHIHRFTGVQRLFCMWIDDLGPFGVKTGTFYPIYTKKQVSIVSSIF